MDGQMDGLKDRQSILLYQARRKQLQIGGGGGGGTHKKQLQIGGGAHINCF